MYKIWMILLFVATLQAEIVGGVAVVVQGDAITLYDIKEEMKLSKVDAKTSSDTLIRKMLETQEITKRGISVTSSDVYDDIKKTAQRNNLSISKFYEAVHSSNGLTSKELKQKIKEKLLSQKLYSAIAYKSMSQPSKDEIEAYYNANLLSFKHPTSFGVVIYQAKDSSRLQEKIDNPMFYSPDISSQEQELPYDKIAPELASMLQKTALNSFTTIIPDGKGGFMSLYLKERKTSQDLGVDGAKNEIINIIMGELREQVLGDYFARLRHNADIKMLREVN